MITFAALATAFINLLLVLLSEREKAQPAKQERTKEQAYERDIVRADEALRAGDATTVSQLFEQERRLGVRDRGVDPRGDDAADGLSPSGQDGSAGAGQH
jgi:hypothetical protein